MKIEKPGLYQISEADYHGDKLTLVPSLSSSGARKLLAECPARFWYDRQNPPEPTKALDIGGAAHEWLLEGDKWSDRFYVLPEDHDGRTKDGKAAIADCLEKGKRPLKFHEFQMIKAMKDALVAHEYAFGAFQDGRNEQSLYWIDEEFGIWCRTRPDCLPLKHKIIGEYKTTRSAEPEYLKKAMWELGYHQQAQWYIEGVEKLGVIENPRFLFVFQEKEPPYLVTCATPDRTALQWAEIQNRKAKHVFAECLSSGKWPAYADSIIELPLPPWADYRLKERLDRGEFETYAAAQAPLEAAE